jgi:3alpha(or 20beta)-hydroxysteroid dehydrogenase
LGVEAGVLVESSRAFPDTRLPTAHSLRGDTTMTGRLDGKVALVTGGARGQGEAEARLFATEGARVVVADVDADGARAVAATLGDAALGVDLDVTDDAAWARVVTDAVTRFGSVDVLVNNAGVGFPPRRLVDEDPDEHRRVLDVNLEGVYLGMRAVTRVMTEHGGGSIVNISSIDGLVGVAGMTSYAASKFAVTGMTRTAALELGRVGIRVNSIHPGVIHTPMVDHAPAETLAALQVVLDRQPIPRMGTPLEVAYLTLYLASDESSYCTGAQFVIDGGHLAGPYRGAFA